VTGTIDEEVAGQNGGGDLVLYSRVKRRGDVMPDRLGRSRMRFGDLCTSRPISVCSIPLPGVQSLHRDRSKGSLLPTALLTRINFKAEYFAFNKISGQRTFVKQIGV
jgi:hypothetical protein